MCTLFSPVYSRSSFTFRNPICRGNMDSSTSGAESMDIDKRAVPASEPAQPVASRKPRATSVPWKDPNFSVGYVYSAEMMNHFSPHGHPEQPLRIQSIWVMLTRDELTKKMKWMPIREVRKDEALLVHSEDHWNKVMALQRE